MKLILGPHTFEFVRLNFWTRPCKGEEAMRELAVTPGFEEALTSFTKAMPKEEGDKTEWEFGQEMGELLLKVIREVIAEGAPNANAIAIISVLDQLKEQLDGEEN